MGGHLGDSPLKRILFRSPAITRTLRLGSAALRHFRKSVHDVDFQVLSCLTEETGLALDIGANSGQSAVSILALKPGFSVISIEPNPNCRPALKFHARLFGQRMRVIHAGGAEANGSLPFFVPVRNGRQLLEEGTFDRQALVTSQSRIGHAGVDYKVVVLDCPVIKIDDLELRPVFVKIDVQGYESQVLKGMLSTLEKCRPLIMVEDGTTTRQVLELVTPLGYVQRFWDGEKLSESNPRHSANFFLCPEICDNS
jgi:FkbM family methyltransferase